MDIVNNADFAERTVAAHYPALREEAVRFGLYQRLDYLLHIPVGRMVSGDAFYVSVKKYLRRHVPDTLGNRYLNRKHKVYLLLMTVAPKTVRQVHAWKMGLTERRSGK